MTSVVACEPELPPLLMIIHRHDSYHVLLGIDDGYGMQMTLAQRACDLLLVHVLLDRGQIRAHHVSDLLVVVAQKKFRQRHDADQVLVLIEDKDLLDVLQIARLLF